MPTLKWLWHSKIMKNDDEGMPRAHMHFKKNKKNHPEDTYQAKHTATHKGLPTVLIACHGVKPVAQISPVNLDCSSLFSLSSHEDLHVHDTGTHELFTLHYAIRGG